MNPIPLRGAQNTHNGRTVNYVRYSDASFKHSGPETRRHPLIMFPVRRTRQHLLILRSADLK